VAEISIGRTANHLKNSNMLCLFSAVIAVSPPIRVAGWLISCHFSWHLVILVVYLVLNGGLWYLQKHQLN